MAKNNYTPEEKQIIKDITRRASLTVPVAFLVLSCVAYALYNDQINFGNYQRTKAHNLNELGPRIKYVLQHSTPGVAWLLFCFFYVVSKRVGTPATDPTSGNEHLTEMAKSIMQNSLEQFAMLFASELILVTYLTGKQTLNVIPTLNLLFFAGRVFFFLGYPKNRSFGMSLGFVPLFSTIAYISYRYLKLYLL